MSAVRRIKNPELREKVRPPLEIGQIFTHCDNKVKIIIKKIEERRVLVEAVAGPTKGKIGHLAIWNLCSTDWRYSEYINERKDKE